MQLNLNPTREQRDAMRAGPAGPVAIVEFVRHRDPQRYDAFLDRLQPVLRLHSGRLVYRARVEQLLIGEREEGWNGVCVLQFRSRDAYLRMLEAEDYREATLVRDAAVDALASLCCRPTSRLLFTGTRLLLRLRALRVSRTPLTQKPLPTSGGLHPTQEQLETLRKSMSSNPVVMLNLLAYRERAQLGDEQVSGAEAYGRYARIAGTLNARLGGSILWSGQNAVPLVGDLGSWQRVAFVFYPSRAAYLELESRSDYREAAVARDAGLERTQLLVTTPSG
jgi:uncharacterized protein (DUF1330 family)